MSHTAPQRYSVPVGSVRHVAVSFETPLGSSELLTGTPLVDDNAPSSPEHLLIINKVVNTSILEFDNGDGSITSVPIGKAVQFTVSGMQAGFTYTIKITATTDAGQTLPGLVVFDCD